MSIVIVDCHNGNYLLKPRDSLFRVVRQLGNGTDRRLVSRAHNQLIAVPSKHNELLKAIFLHSNIRVPTLDTRSVQAMGSDSPVSEEFSVLRPRHKSKTISAGTLSPLLIRTRSPGTNCSTSTFCCFSLVNDGACCRLLSVTVKDNDSESGLSQDQVCNVFVQKIDNNKLCTVLRNDKRYLGILFQTTSPYGKNLRKGSIYSL
jgi:hypothetical protein